MLCGIIKKKLLENANLGAFYQALCIIRPAYNYPNYGGFYEVPDNIFDREFSIYLFKGATKEWLEFVVNNRRGKGTKHYDLIMGPVADDQLYATIRLYEQGVVTAGAAIEMLKTHKLFNQLSFHTAKVIPLLKFTEAIEV